MKLTLPEFYKALMLKKTLKKGKKYQVSLLRFDKRSNRYRILSIQFKL